jgi:uncharacterized repeat protein (TIGR02543 family)
MRTKEIFGYGTRNLFFAFAVILTLAFAALFLTGCENPLDGLDELNTLSGAITISPSSTVPVNTELTATYSGSETVSFQWKKDGVNVGTASTTNPSKYTPAEAGSYTVTVSAAGYAPKTSDAVEVTVTGAAALTLGGEVTVTPNTDVYIGTELTANYSGSETVSYQWKKDGENVGTNSNKYTPTAAGNHTVTVSAAGYTSKMSAGVEVTDPSLPTLSGSITISPNGSVVNTELTATYNGSETVSFQWKKDGVNAGTASTTNPNKYTPTEAGSYTVTVSASGYNSKTSNPVTVSPPITIVNAEIEITAPVKGEAPDTTATTDEENFTIGTVSWSPADNPFKGGEVYTATVTLTANSGHTFTGLSKSTVNGQNAQAADNTGAAVTLSYTFAETDTRTATNLAIKTQPNKMTYTHGDQLDLTGLEVTLTFDDGSSDNVAAEDFKDRNISASPSHGDHLVHSTRNGHPVVISYGSHLSQNTGNLTVNQKAISHESITVSIPEQTYNGSALEPTVTVKDGATTLESPDDYTVEYADNTDAGTASVTITGARDYSDSRTENFTINKANPTVTWPTGLTATFGATLSSISLPGNGTSTPAGTFTWTTPSASVGAVGTQSHNMTFTPTDTANYNTATQNVNITVSYRVSFNTNGGGSIADQLITTSDGKATEPQGVTRIGYNFAGWFKDDTTFQNQWNFATDTVTQNITLYAKWNPPIPLTLNTWADGSIPTANGQEWFSFTATATSHYIHFDYTGTLNSVNVQLYTTAGATQGSETRLYNSSSYASRSGLTAGTTYYIRVRPYDSNGSGTYKIAFNASSTAPAVQLPTNAIPLTLNTWADGSIPTANGQQWFSFTATSSYHYIHFDTSGTLNDVYVQLYDSNGTTVGSETRLYSSTTSYGRSLTSGTTYYIRVRPYDSAGSGAYRIGFTTSTTAPTLIQLPTNAVSLTANEWADGSIAVANGQEWFVFTATTSTTHYIHFDSTGTLNDVNVQLYTSTGTTLVTQTRLNSSTTSISRTLTSGNTYYIRVRPYDSAGSGSYRIGFNTSTAAPIDLPTNAIPLTINQWANGSIPTANGQQWFSFTATATSHYIHFDHTGTRSEERRVGKESGIACRARGST